jgi:hypothetical protein
VLKGCFEKVNAMKKFGAQNGRINNQYPFYQQTLQVTSLQG